MSFLLDTNIISDLMRRILSPALIRRLAITPPEDQGTSSITVGELYYGARRLGAPGDALVKRIEAALPGNLVVHSFDAPAAKVYGALRSELERRGTPIGDADLRIASIALANELIVVTGNVRHFERVPRLAVENWLV